MTENQVFFDTELKRYVKLVKRNRFASRGRIYVTIARIAINKHALPTAKNGALAGALITILTDSQVKAKLRHTEEHKSYDQGSTIKNLPFCGAKSTGIEFEEHPIGRAGYVLKIKHKDQCFIEHMSNAYYGAPEDCAAEWDGRVCE